MLLHDVLAAATSSFPEPSLTTAGLRKLDGYLAEFTVLAGQWGFQLILAIVPDPNSLVGDHPSVAFGTKVEAMASGRGIPVVDLLAPLRDLYRRTQRLHIIPYDPHYTGDANEVMARRVVQEILRLSRGGDRR
jgi:hypothetical protein